MGGVRATRMGALLALFAGALLLIALTPASAQAAWTGADVRIADPMGTGFVPLLNVSIVNHATNDSAAVTTVQFSDDGADWYVVPYTGAPCDWVLPGESGRKTVAVRFGASDGSVSPVVDASINVDTAGPTTIAGAARVAAGGRTAFAYVVRDAGSPRVAASLVVRGHGINRRYELGGVAVGRHVARLGLGLPSGSYRWRIEATDLAGWVQERQVPGALVLK